ncbi:acyl-CoA thioesterase I [Pseudoalteromonas ulvae UL12]|uniref:Arylesterase n=1 Tax=Pseudoalteromonas ulvae TaxID=107327 RepID=A0A244CW52_PSEDV|nr:arylesterase [Pseudoalteromonas ulvae]MBE0362332.1 acyl-CoA thioesterase I [Pseudoalteromonas ulvae UL12]OUL59656.1 arylesterase [Pseudoalteromonas ulvae]
MTPKIIRFFIFVILLSNPAISFAKQTVLIIGDSLSAAYGMKQHQGWVKLLQDKYQQSHPELTLVNASVSGQTSGNALLTLAGHLEQTQPTHVLIELGANDGLRGFPIKGLQKDLTALVEQSHAFGAHVALMEIHITPNLGPRYTQMFTASFEKVAFATESYLMPFFMLEVADDPSLMQNDNLHPNVQAQPIIRDFMSKEINKWLEKTTN